MENLLIYYTKNMEISEGIQEKVLLEKQFSLGITLPKELLSFFRFTNGAEGIIGNHYLVIWSIDELVQLNKTMSIEINAPGLLLFGSDGGGEAYGFDLRNNRQNIVRVPLIGLDWKYAKAIGDSFNDFLKKLMENNSI